MSIGQKTRQERKGGKIVVKNSSPTSFQSLLSSLRVKKYLSINTEKADFKAVFYKYQHYLYCTSSLHWITILQISKFWLNMSNYRKHSKRGNYFTSALCKVILTEINEIFVVEWEKKCILHFSKLLTVCAPSQMMTLSPVFKNLVNSPANLSFNDGSPTPQSSTYILAL